MIHTRKDRTLYFISGVIAAAFIAGLIYATAEDKRTSLRMIFIYLSVGFATFIVLYGLNLASIWLSQPDDLALKIRARWQRVLGEGESLSPFGVADDYLDRAALLVVSLQAKILSVGGEPHGPRRPAAQLIRAHEDEHRKDIEKITALQTEVSVLENRLRQIPAELQARAKAFSSVWLCKKRPRSEPTFLHRDDPIYGQLGIHEKLYPILCHPLIQRLNYVRQLSFAYLTFPSASHTRLSHLFGVAKNAQEVLRKVITKQVAYRSLGRDQATGLLRLESKLVPLSVTPEKTNSILLKAQLCALLHDVGHGPFGHALDKLVPYHGDLGRTDPPDTVYGLKYIKDYLGAEISEAGFQPDEIVKILDKEQKDELTGFDVLIADLIASPVDIDRMDFLVRDAHMTGLEMGFINTEALREQMYPLEESGDYKLVYAPAALSEMEDLAQAHHNMYIHCYEHPRKVASERLLVRAVTYLLANGLPKDDLMLLSDDQLIALLSEFLSPETAQGQCFRALRENVHFLLVAEYHLSIWDPVAREMKCNPKLSATVRAWYDERAKGKQFLKRVYVESPLSWEEQICRAVGLREEDRWKVIVTVPAYDAKLQQESGALVVRKDASGLFLDDFYNASAILRNLLTILVPERHVLRVHVTEDLAADAAKLGKAAEDLFMGATAPLADSPALPVA